MSQLPPRPVAHVEAALSAIRRLVVREVGGLLDRLRSGVSITDRLTELFEEILRAQQPAAPAEAEQAPAADVDAEEVREAIEEGVRRAARSGTVAPDRTSDAVAWALTSLLMTLVMRAREGEDTDRLVAVATEAMRDLLTPA